MKKTNYIFHHLSHPSTPPNSSMPTPTHPFIEQFLPLQCPLCFLLGACCLVRCRSLNGLCGDLNGHLHGLGKAVSHVHVNRLNSVDVNPGDNLQEGRGIEEVETGWR